MAFSTQRFSWLHQVQSWSLGPLSLGADIELGASTPLMEASQEGHVNIVKFLMDKGALINAETNTGDTALTYACANGHTHIADILLQCGAELVSVV